MTANTPIYGFTYPCESEAINPAAFATLAQQIDTKLQDVQGDANMAVGRYSSIQSMSPNQGGFASGVEAAFTNTGSTYVTPIAGIYVTDCLVACTATTITSMRVRVRLNAVAQYGRSYNNATASATAGPFVVPGVPMVCAAGDTISAAFLFFGTGAGSASLRINFRMILRLA